MIKRICISLACLSSLVLTGCLSLSSQPSVEQWSGRFALSAHSAQHRENHSGRFLLMRTELDRQVLELKTSLGNTVARIESFDGGLKIQTIGHETIESSDSEALMLSLLGFSVPIEGLIHWIDGQPSPQSKAEVIPTSEPFQEIQQHGWKIQYPSYDAEGKPRKIIFIRQATDRAPAIKATLIISERMHGTP